MEKHLFYGRIQSDRWKDRLSFTRCQSGLDMFLRMWQALVVTELAPEHQSNEKSQRSFTTHRFTDTFFSRSSLCSDRNNKCMSKEKRTNLLSIYLSLDPYQRPLDRSQQASFLSTIDRSGRTVLTCSLIHQSRFSCLILFFLHLYCQVKL